MTTTAATATTTTATATTTAAGTTATGTTAAGTRGHLRRWGVGRPVAFAVLVSLLAAACSIGGGGAGTTSADSSSEALTASSDSAGGGGDLVAADGGPADTSGAIDTSGDASEADGATEAALALTTTVGNAPAGRDIVFTADIAVRVDDVTEATRRAIEVVGELGGFVFGQQTSGEPDPRTVVTFKIEPAAFDAALDGLGGIGDLVEQRISADDVTDRVVDLESRITTAEASVTRLRDLLTAASGLDDIAQLENQLLERETLLEQLRGQLRTLQDQVALATITLTITRRDSVAPPAGIDLVASLSRDSGDDACPGGGEVEVGPDDAVVLCFEITNTGDADLVDVTLEATGLRLRDGDLEILDGSGLDRLTPGETLVLAHREQLVDGRFARIDLTRTGGSPGIDLTLRVSATPVDDEGQRFGEIGDVDVVGLRVVEPVDRPGFLDGLSGGWTAFVWFVALVALVAGVLVPWSPIIALVTALVVWRRRRASAQAATGSSPGRPGTSSP